MTEEFAAIVDAAVASGSRYALLGIGFGLLCSVFGYFSMSFPLVVVVSAFGAYLARRALDLPLMGVAAVAVFSGVLCLILHAQTIDRMRSVKRIGDPALFMFVATGALFVCGRNGLLIAFGPGSLYADYAVSSGVAAVIALVMALAIEAILANTRKGLELRAVASSASLAATSGLRVPQIELVAAGLAGACAGLAAFFVAAEQDVRFSMGNDLLLGAALCAFVGGGSRPLPIALVGFAVGAVNAVAIWVVPSGWTDFILGAALLGVLLAAPRSIARLLQQPIRRI